MVLKIRFNEKLTFLWIRKNDWIIICMKFSFFVGLYDFYSSLGDKYKIILKYFIVRVSELISESPDNLLVVSFVSGGSYPAFPVSFDVFSSAFSSSSVCLMSE